jgi:hypothetical protein
VVENPYLYVRNSTYDAPPGEQCYDDSITNLDPARAIQTGRD